MGLAPKLDNVSKADGNLHDLLSEVAACYGMTEWDSLFFLNSTHSHIDVNRMLSNYLLPRLHFQPYSS